MLNSNTPDTSLHHHAARAAGAHAARPRGAALAAARARAARGALAADARRGDLELYNMLYTT